MKEIEVKENIKEKKNIKIIEDINEILKKEIKGDLW